MKKKSSTKTAARAALEPSRQFQYVRVNNYVDGQKPKTEKQWINLANDLLKWAALPSSLLFNEFPLAHKYSPSRFKKWDDNDYFVEAVETARHMCWARLDKAVLERDIIQFVARNAHLHNPEEEAWQREKLSKDDKQTGPQIVVIEKYPETNIVPIKGDR